MIPDDENNGLQNDFFTGISDLDSVRLLLAEIHDDLLGRVTRLRYLSDLSLELGSQGTILYGASATFGAWSGARSSFVHGNYVSTILVCQSLAAFLHGGLVDELSPRISFKDTLKRCQVHDLITEEDCRDLNRLMALRNPLSHFRNINDDQNLDRRAMDTGLLPDELLRHDAWFSIALAVRILGKPQFRVE